MSRLKKILIIIQLCLAFSFLFWLFIQPYVKNYVLKKTEAALYETLFSKNEMFSALDAQTQALLQNGYETINLRKNATFFSQLKFAFHETHPLAFAWLFFALVVSFLLLFHVKNAPFIAWILPSLVVFYAIFLAFEKPKLSSSIFPSENYVLQKYTSNNDSQLSDKDRLRSGWQRYLITEWAHENPSENKEVLDSQLDKALFAFNVERLLRIREGKGDSVILLGFYNRPSLINVIFYFIWNIFFAWGINRRSKSTVTSELKLSEAP